MTDTLPGRSAGLLAIVAGIAGVALLAIHPGGGAHDFPGVLKDEAAHRAVGAIVHGGFVVVLALETVCYAALTMRLGRLSATAGLVFFAFGAALLAASMVLDGLAIPALALRYLAVPGKIEFARSLFALVGALIAILMPLGIAFQSAAMAAWGWALIASGASRIAGVLGLVLGGVVLAALAATLGTMNPVVLIGGIAALALWAMIVGVVILRGALVS